MNDAMQKLRKLPPEAVPLAIGILAGAGTIASFLVVQYLSWIETPHHPGEVTRVIFGGIPFWLKVIFYITIASFLIATGFMFSRRTRNWTRGAPERRKLDRRSAERRMKRLGQGLRMQTLLQDPQAGMMHSLIYFGFTILFIGTVTVEIEDLVPTSLKFLHGNVYLAFSFILEIAGLMLFAGLCWAVWRRYVQRVYRTRIKTRPENVVILGTLFAIAITGFVVEAFRIAASGFPSFETWSFVGYWLGKGLVAIGGGDGPWVVLAHQWFWTVHFAVFALFLLLLPTTMLRHMITSPMNLYLSDRERPRGAMRPMPNLMEAEIEQIGAAEVKDFTWKQLFDTDACTMCGRCTSVCPAHNTGKPLDPREIVLKVGEVMNLTAGFSTTQEGEMLVEGEMHQVESPTTPPIGIDKEITVSSETVFERVTSEELWSCVTCRACDEICPVDIEIVDKILDMRRYLSLMESDFPTQLGNAYRGMENAGNPWGMGQQDRTSWAEKLDFELPVIGETYEGIPEYLWWVGCAGSFDDRNVNVSRSIAKLLHDAEIDFAVLGSNEMCTGDPARRSGNEYVFQMLALQNIETLGEAGVKKVIAQCPHCFNTLKNEYPYYGGNYDVVHHSQLLEELVESGRLSLDGEIAAKVTYHDSCYLGRYNDVFAAPRKILGNIKGIDVVEMPRNGTGSFCCGAGGARMFMEEHTGKKIQIERTQEAVATGADTVATACPFCYVMLDDGIKEEGHEETHRVADVSVLMAEALEARMAEAAAAKDS